MSGPIGVGLIGAGTISKQYLENLTTFPDIVVHSIGMSTNPSPRSARVSSASRPGVELPPRSGIRMSRS